MDAADFGGAGGEEACFVKRDDETLGVMCMVMLPGGMLTGGDLFGEHFADGRFWSRSLRSRYCELIGEVRARLESALE